MNLVMSLNAMHVIIRSVPVVQHMSSIINTNTPPTITYLQKEYLFPSAELLSTHAAGEAGDVVHFVHGMSYQVLGAQSSVAPRALCTEEPNNGIGWCALFRLKVRKKTTLT